MHPGAPAPLLKGGHIAHVWANEGGDKVTRDKLRATNDPTAVHNSVWDGAGISVFGTHNEVVAFNLVLEVPMADATSVAVSLTSLTGPSGASIATVPATGDGVFNYVGRNIELFYVGYLQIRGLSIDLAYEDYDGWHIPERCRRPYDENGIGTSTWQDRPCHDKFYPDIAVPLELHTPFTITAGTNQSIWGDIYIPKTVPAGVYSGTIAGDTNYYPDCDVSQDGQINIEDLQRVAARWKVNSPTGTWAGHFGDTWSDSGAFGLKVQNSGAGGVGLWGDGSPGVKATSFGGTGLYASSFLGSAARFENAGSLPTVVITNVAGTSSPALQATGHMTGAIATGHLTGLVGIATITETFLSSNHPT